MRGKNVSFLPGTTQNPVIKINSRKLEALQDRAVLSKDGWL